MKTRNKMFLIFALVVLMTFAPISQISFANPPPPESDLKISKAYPDGKGNYIVPEEELLEMLRYIEYLEREAAIEKERADALKAQLDKSFLEISRLEEQNKALRSDETRLWVGAGVIVLFLGVSFGIYQWGD